MVKAEVKQMATGYIVAVDGLHEYGKVYVSKNWKGKYAYVCDYAHAKRFGDIKTAKKHAKAIMEQENKATLKELVEHLEWLECHNKQYTKEQYYRISEALEIAKGFYKGEKE